MFEIMRSLRFLFQSAFTYILSLDIACEFEAHSKMTVVLILSSQYWASDTHESLHMRSDRISRFYCIHVFNVNFFTLLSFAQEFCGKFYPMRRFLMVDTVQSS